MPYIGAREWIDERLAPLLNEFPADPNITPGEVNYMVTKIIRAWLGAKPRYEDFNAALGVLEAAKLELYRRLVAPYEDKKKEENGDVY